jgi:NADH dehydrogenase [ubiquinone] 1 alpha subcomplex assembly factor 1
MLGKITFSIVCRIVSIGFLSTGFVSIGLICGSAEAQESEPRVLFDFAGESAARQWQAVNDGVMGGRSDGKFRIDDRGIMQFYGTLSLENNGGFASVRSRGRPLDLQLQDTLVARLRGDGRRYTFNLYVPSRRTAFSYRVEFPTKKDEWIEVRVPLEDFVATSFGRTLNGAGPVDARKVNSIGFLLGDKKPGSFQLEIDWIRTERSGDVDAARLN